MSAFPQVTRQSVLSAAADLTGCLITGVTYLGLRYADEEWDHGRYHEAVMGVQLSCPDGRQFSVTWGSAFGDFGTELSHGALPGSGDHRVSRDFTAHPWWKPFAAAPVTARVIWRTGYCCRAAYEPDQPAPLAITVEHGGHLVWIVAAEYRSTEHSYAYPGGFWLGADALLVTADQQFPLTLGLRNKHRSSQRT